MLDNSAFCRGTPRGFTWSFYARRCFTDITIIWAGEISAYRKDHSEPVFLQPLEPQHLACAAPA